jgi:hypothetical protein
MTIRELRSWKVETQVFGPTMRVCVRLPRFSTKGSRSAHYAMRSWRKSYSGTLNLSGQYHGRLPGDDKICRWTLGLTQTASSPYHSSK